MTTITMEKHILKRLDALEDFAKEIRAALSAPATAPEPVATVAEVHMSRYTLEWTNGPLPEGTKLYAAPQAQPERKPMTKGQREQVARRAEAAMNGNVNLSWRDALISEPEAFHDIKETP